MRDTTRRMRRTAAGLLLLVGLTSMTAPAHADDKALTTEGSLRDALVRLGEGKPVELVLTNGKSYKGKLGKVGTDTVLVTDIAGKEYYDVLIEIDDVSAVEVRARGN